MKAVLLALLIAALAKFLADEAKEWANWLPAKLIHWASKQFPLEAQPRLQEEWLAHCNDLPGSLAKLLHATGCLSTAFRLELGRRALTSTIFWIFFPLYLVLSPLFLMMDTLDKLRGAHKLYDAWPDVVRAKRQRSSAAGLTVLGIANLNDIREDDVKPLLQHIARLETDMTKRKHREQPGARTRFFESAVGEALVSAAGAGSEPYEAFARRVFERLMRRQGLSEFLQFYPCPSTGETTDHAPAA